MGGGVAQWWLTAPLIRCYCWWITWNQRPSRGVYTRPGSALQLHHYRMITAHLFLILAFCLSATGAGRQVGVQHNLVVRHQGQRHQGQRSDLELSMPIDREEPQTDMALGVTAVPRQADSVIPEEYFKGPHNINPHHYNYVINNVNVCLEQQDVLLLIMVRTVIGHVDRRMAIRDSWGASYNLPSVVMPTVFLLGAASNIAEQKEIDLENRIYRDIIQEDFIDTYHNLTLKNVMAYKWARTYCPHADFVMVGNDDVVVDIFKLVPYLQSIQYRSRNQFAICYLFPCCMMAEKRGASKFKFNHIGWNVYTGKAYPAYCSASMYVVPSAVIHKLYHMSGDTPSFMPDEPWVGVLAEKLGLTFSDTFRSYVGIEPNSNLIHTFNISDYLQTPTMVGITGRSFPHKEAEMIRKVWSLILSHHRDQPPLDVQRYMGQTTEDSDGHIYQVALAALLIDLGVMVIIGYIIFCRRRPKSVSHHSTQHTYPRA